jgi:hypothetical protein
MGDLPVRPPWPPPALDRPVPATPERTRHVWVRAPLGRAGAKQGLVVTWRQVARGPAPATWQALVVVVDDRYESISIDWHHAAELEPVRTPPPG